MFKLNEDIEATTTRLNCRKCKPRLNRSLTMNFIDSSEKRRERLKHSSCRNYDKLIRNSSNNNRKNIKIELNYEDINLNSIIKNREEQQQQQHELITSRREELSSTDKDRYILIEEEEEEGDEIIKHDYESINGDIITHSSSSSSSSPPKIQPRRIYMNYSAASAANKVNIKVFFLKFILFQAQ